MPLLDRAQLSQLAPADSRSRLAAWARAQLLAAYQPSVARQYLEQLAWHQGRSSLEQLRRLGGPVQPYVDDVLSQPQGAYR